MGTWKSHDIRMTWTIMFCYKSNTSFCSYDIKAPRENGFHVVCVPPTSFKKLKVGKLVSLFQWTEFQSSHFSNCINKMDKCMQCDAMSRPCSMKIIIDSSRLIASWDVKQALNHLGNCSSPISTQASSYYETWLFLKIFMEGMIWLSAALAKTVKSKTVVVSAYLTSFWKFTRPVNRHH